MPGRVRADTILVGLITALANASNSGPNGVHGSTIPAIMIFVGMVVA